MKYLIILVFLVGCESKTDVLQKCKISYITDKGYSCSNMQYFTWGIRVVDCTSLSSGMKVKQIYNPTNVVEVCK